MPHHRGLQHPLISVSTANSSNMSQAKISNTIITTHRLVLPLTGLKPGMDGLPETIWQELIAFQDWHKWMPSVGAVTRVDSGAFGRGSTFQVARKRSVNIWSISCWDPPRRLEIITECRGRQLAYGFSLVADNTSAELAIELDVECIPRIFPRPMMPLLRWHQRRYGQKLLNGFIRSLLNE